MGFRKRVLVLPLTAIVILALVTYKRSRTYAPTDQSTVSRVAMRPTPIFEGLDAHNVLVKYERYVGRHRILVVFFDGDAGADQDPVLLRLKQGFAKLKANGAVVVAVSTALPQHNRQVMERSGPFPFPLVSDPTFEIHRAWGRFDEKAKKPLQGVFSVDRAGRVAYEGGKPKPVTRPDAVVDDLIGG